ncbi:MAG TPA: sodium-independent anion transporter [Bacteroidetes bacterium]|nr:sodium-independent anion transporter [Bacteroidota bacterium]
MIQTLKKWVPIIQWLPQYEKTSLKGDLSAGLTVAVMLIPQGMAYSVLAGLPPVYGLYASIIPLIIYAIFGTSKQLAVGPVAMVGLIVFAGVSAFATPGSPEFIQLAILAALGVGVVQALMGFMRMGFLVNFLSHPVLSGFTSAAAIIIGASQLKSLLGIDMPGSLTVVETFGMTISKIGSANFYTAIIGVGSVIMIMLLKKWNKAFPSALAVVFLGTISVIVFGLNELGVRIVGEVPKGFPAFLTPSIDIDSLIKLLPMILVISLVGYMESIAIAKAIANRRKYKIDSNQELIGLGFANIVGSFFQSFPVTGGLSRTAVNDQAGAETPLAAILSAILIAITVVFLTPLFYYLPNSVLAAIIIVAVSSLFDIKAMKHLWNTDRLDLGLLTVTFLTTLFLGIEVGIGIGVILSLVIVIYNSTKPHFAELGQLEESDNYRNVERYKNAVIHEDVLIFRYDSPLYFASSNYFLDTTQKLIRNRATAPKLFVLDASSINFLDSTGLHALEELLKFLSSNGIEFSIVGAIGPVRDMLKKCGIMSHIGVNRFYFDVAEAVDDFRMLHTPSSLNGEIKIPGKLNAAQSNYL